MREGGRQETGKRKVERGEGGMEALCLKSAGGVLQDDVKQTLHYHIESSAVEFICTSSGSKCYWKFDGGNYLQAVH